MLAGRSEKAERRANKAQSLYVPSTSSSLSSSLPTTSLMSSGQNFLPPPLLNTQLSHQNDSSPPTSSSASAKSPRKTRPYSMFVHPHDELNNAQHQQKLGMVTASTTDDIQEHSDEDNAEESQPGSVLEFGENDLLNADADTQMLIAHLADLDTGLPILLDRVKQNLHSCKDLASFLRKRSVLEAEYGTNMAKMVTSFKESYRQPETKSQTKQGTYGDCWSHFLDMHEKMANNKLEYSRDLQVVAEELTSIYKETERSRKQFKEAGAKQERMMQEHQQNLEKAKFKYDAMTEDWERSILQKAADPNTPKRTLTKTMTINLFRQPKSVGQLHKQEEEAKAKAHAARDQYKLALTRSNDAKHYYFANTLPSILKNLKDNIDESDLSLQYYLVRYAYMTEDSVMKDAVILSPVDESELGLRDRIELVNRESDLQVYIQIYAARAHVVQRDATPYEEYTMSQQAQTIINPHPIFGVDLAEQLIRDETDLPEIVVKCTQAIEQYGLDTKGIYRVSGITSATNRLKFAFDRDCSAVDLDSEENCGDINSVTGVLKLWFRELPDPLMTRKMYPEFIKAVSIEDPQLRLMHLHDCVNRLPDPNYATLRFLMAHLNRIQKNQEENKMGASNLGLIFGPTLTSSSTGGDVHDLADMGLQCSIIETILDNYDAIFEMDAEEQEGEGEVEGEVAEQGDEYTTTATTTDGLDDASGVPLSFAPGYLPPPPN